MLHGPSRPVRQSENEAAYVAQLRAVMQANPTLRVFVANGYYDTQTTIGAMDYLVSQGGFPRDRVRTRYYHGGHVFYTVESSLRLFSEDVRDMVNHQW
jgi:carboxypeptidase C (cathepsin A)